MNYVLGIDVGARYTKAVLLDLDGEEIARAGTTTGVFFAQAAEKARQACCEQAGIEPDEIGYVATTGYGRYRIPFRQVQITEITCHARGAVALFPGTRTVIDGGAQTTRAMRVGPEGRIRAFRQNDKCASGSGRFLERVAKALELRLEEVGPRALQAQAPCEISSICAVLAESEVINLVSQEKPTEDILAGAHRAITGRVASLVKPLKPEPEVTLTGGVVHNPAFVRWLSDALGCPINVSPDAEYAGALGAALLGRYRLQRVAA
ncbi:MAG: acyl-CoA dehydratase activase [Gemmatimonadota bacterium]